MKHLKLCKGLSYMGHGIYATRRAPDVFVEDAATAAALLATGYFAEGDGSTTKPPKAPTGTIDTLDTMGATKLRSYAKEKGLDLSWPKGTDADTIRVDIKEALDKAEEDEGDPASQFTTGDGSGDNTPPTEDGGSEGGTPPTDGDDGSGASPSTGEDE